MKIDKKAIFESRKIHSAISEKLKENSEEVKEKVDLTNIAKKLAERRVEALREEEE